MAKWSMPGGSDWTLGWGHERPEEATPGDRTDRTPSVIPAIQTRRIGWPVTIVSMAFAVGLLISAPSPAWAAKAKNCKPGQGRLEVGRKVTCVKAGSLLPHRKLGPNTLVGWFDAALDPGIGASAKKVLPKRLRGPEMGRGVAGGVKSLRKKLAPYSAGMEGRARGAKLSAFTTAPITVTTNQTSNSASIRGSIKGTDSATGTTTEASIEMRAKAGSETLDFDLAGTVTDRDGKSKTTELSVPLDFKTLKSQRCPTAAGEVSRSSKVSVRRTTRERGTPPGFEYRNESVTITAPIVVDGRVNADAELESVSYRVNGSFSWAYAASVLRGIGRGNVQVNVDFDAQGTLDGRTGATTSGTTALSGRMRALGLNSKEEKAEMAKSLADPGFRDSFLKLVAKLVQAEFESLKKSEKAWQVPNACAKMALTPPGATLNEGDFKAVSGAVSAEDGKPTEGRWSVVAKSRGDVTGVPGASSASTPIEMEMSAGAASASGRTVDVSLRATSPAGVAESPWTADSNEQALYFRVVGGSGSQTASGTLESGSCIYDQVGGVGPWTYAFQQTSGPPDGEVLVDSFGVSGYVRGSGVSTLPAYTWRSVCSGTPSTVPHAPISYEGKFGPTVEFFPIPGQSEAVKAQWSVLSPPPIFQIEASGPDCTPNELEPGSAFAGQVSLSTLRQTAPFTLSIDAPWTKVSEFGGLYTECEGHTTLTLTLQRVSADGSPLG